LVITSGILAVPLPTETAPATTVPPAVAAQRPPLSGGLPITPPMLFGFGPGASPTWPAATGTGSTESTLVTLPHNDAPPPQSAGVTLAPYMPPIPSGSLSLPAARGPAQSAGVTLPPYMAPIPSGSLS